MTTDTQTLSPRHRVADLRERILTLARGGLRMPIGTHLMLHEQPDPEAVLRDGRRLGEVTMAAARRYKTPLALPVMDLALEKSDLLRRLGIAQDQWETYHFDAPPTEAQLQLAQHSADAPFDPRGRAHLEAIRYVAGQPDLIACGMAIGPFSLMTKLLADPITAVAMAGMGVTAAEDPEVAMVEAALALAQGAVKRALNAQIQAGARLICICEPAANIVYLSPKQIAKGSDIFQRFVMQPNLHVAEQLESAGVGLLFHDCGELIDEFVNQFAHRLHPAILSLGSSRKLWEDAKLVPEDVVLFGNLPTKRFYSDGDMPDQRVTELARELTQKMTAAGHPFILGSECDVLSVEGRHEAISKKVELMLRCACS